VNLEISDAQTRIYIFSKKGDNTEKNQCLTPVILATQDAEIRRTVTQSQPRQIVPKTLSWKKSHKKKWARGVAQGVGSEFKSLYQEKKKPNEMISYM
jgi:uncharacterized NAD(P)/FAD-binding protein YdhS